ncbi:hypothetical protein AMAG_09341 [Allomyces macrogynus ATCC 38327]|uniref:MIF4G domain-containing protein n=1 Tax=Allomyces macrogynus (strain ATCC 38327) TaxID=578462 RepID=A0A0L0SP97_ALLM3|nr:hypothetical protein AMAG_09341 [Allomyces macrogynus ATCC 38327]|eukprot:KNE64312.1 hypothetical protein AMAG_09341 [Allomyces macrogynus ATCC 38327]
MTKKHHSRPRSVSRRRASKNTRDKSPAAASAAATTPVDAPPVPKVPETVEEAVELDNGAGAAAEVTPAEAPVAEPAQVQPEPEVAAEVTPAASPAPAPASATASPTARSRSRSKSPVKVVLRDPTTHVVVDLPAGDEDPKETARRAIAASKENKSIAIQAPKAATPAAPAAVAEAEVTPKSASTESPAPVPTTTGDLFRYTKDTLLALRRVFRRGVLRQGLASEPSAAANVAATAVPNAPSPVARAVGPRDLRDPAGGDRNDARRGPRRFRTAVGPRQRGERDGESSRGGGRRGGDRGDRGGDRNGGQPGARGVELLPEDLKPLEKSESRWVPNLDRKALDEVPEDEAEYIALMEKKTRGLLNKLSPENYDRLKDKFLFKPKFMEAVTAVCGLLVRKSFEEPKYASLYAKLTLHYCQSAPLPEEVEEDEASKRAMGAHVRKLIIMACQRQFETRPSWTEKPQMTEEEYEAVVKIKTKALGNMRFVAELYNSGVVSKKVISMIVTQLVSSIQSEPKQEDIECALTLLATIGRGVDASLDPQLVAQWFALLAQAKDNEAILSRLRFAIADLIDLRAAGWRKDGSVVPTPVGSSAGTQRQNSTNNNTTGGSTRGQPRRNEANADGWIASPSASSQGRRRDPAKASRFGRGGDQGGRNDRQASGTGGRRGGARQQQEPVKKTTANLFDMFHHMEEQQNQDEEPSSAEVSPSDAQPAETVPEPEAEAAPAKPANGAVPVEDQPEMTEDEVSSKAEAIVKNMLSSKEASEFVDDVKKITKYLPGLIMRSLELVTEKKEAEATLFGKALAMTINEGIVTADDMVAALADNDFMEYYEDMKMDIPQLDKLFVAFVTELRTAKGVTDEHVQRIATKAGGLKL